MTVERLENETWAVVLTDAHWETKLKWERYLIDESIVTAEWTLDSSVLPGTYRIQHFGYYKPLLGDPQPYSGVSGSFTVENS